MIEENGVWEYWVLGSDPLIQYSIIPIELL